MDERDRTLWVGNLSDRVTEELLYELFLQAGPLLKVKIPSKDGRPQKFAFITFKHACSVPYTVQLFDGIKLFGSALKLQHRSGSIHDNTFQNHNSPNPHSPSDYHHRSGQGSSRDRYSQSPHYSSEDNHSPSLQRSHSRHGSSDNRSQGRSHGRSSDRKDDRKDYQNMDKLSLTGNFSVTSPQARDMDPLSMQIRRERVLSQQNSALEVHRHRRQHHAQNPYDRGGQQPWQRRPYRQ